MKDYYFTTNEELSTNEITMQVFLDEYFNDVFTIKDKIILLDGTYAEVNTLEGVYGVHASGNGDFRNHKIRFEKI